MQRGPMPQGAMRAGRGLSKFESPRYAQRQPLRAAVQFRKGTSRAQVDLLDISTHGVRITAMNLLRNGDRFWLKLPDLAPQEVRVAWTEDFVIGCEFFVPLHPSVVERLLTKG